MVELNKLSKRHIYIGINQFSSDYKIGVELYLFLIKKLVSIVINQINSKFNYETRTRYNNATENDPRFLFYTLVAMRTYVSQKPDLRSERGAGGLFDQIDQSGVILVWRANSSGGTGGVT